MAFDKKDIGAAWERVSSRGTQYLNIQLELDGRKIRLVAFKNGYKEKDNQPDWKIYPDDDREPQAAAQSPAAAPKAPAVEPATSFTYPEENIDPEDIPF